MFNLVGLLFVLVSGLPSAKGSHWIPSNPEENQGKISLMHSEPKGQSDSESMIYLNSHYHLDGNASWGFLLGMRGVDSIDGWDTQEGPLNFFYRSGYEKQNKIGSPDWSLKIGIPIAEDDSMSWGLSSRTGGFSDDFLFANPFYWGLGFSYETHVDNPEIKNVWHLGSETVWSYKYDYGLRLEHFAKTSLQGPRESALDWSFWIKTNDSKNWKMFAVTIRDEARNLPVETIYEVAFGWED
ncbi:hypothetical protein CL643_03985 [bacterium]|nr:hypothetical protein [bacterium]|tara:strand:+ start:119 stop:838 length:720 start_codon:yes stop_codon:yes gene_type:complete